MPSPQDPKTRDSVQVNSDEKSIITFASTYYVVSAIMMRKKRKMALLSVLSGL